MGHRLNRIHRFQKSHQFCSIAPHFGVSFDSEIYSFNVFLRIKPIEVYIIRISLKNCIQKDHVIFCTTVRYLKTYHLVTLTPSFLNTDLCISNFLILSCVPSDKKGFYTKFAFLMHRWLFWVNNSRWSWTVLQLHSVCQALLETSVDDMVPMRKIHWSKSKAKFDIETLFWRSDHS